jgi:serine phosphatase RsbU (regulator of sigma subunit)
MKLRTRLTLSSAVIIIVVITIMLIILELGIDDLTFLNIRTSNQGIDEVIDKNVKLSENILTDYGKKIVELKAESAAHQLSLLLAGRESYDYPTLQKNNQLRKIATQDIYAGYPERIKAGYIAVVDNSGHTLFHPNSNIEDHNLGEWKGKFPAMWEMVERSFAEDEVSGFYNFFDKDTNETRQKYMVIYRVKGTPFSVYATVYIGEYFKPVQRAIEEAGQAESLNAETRIEETAEVFSEKVKTKGFFLGMAVLVLAGLFGWWAAARLARPVLRLQSGVRKMGDGDFSVEVPAGGSSEVVELTRSFNHLGSQLKDYMENLKKEVTARQMVESEVKIARQIQESLLPRSFPPFPNHQGFDLYAVNLAAKEVAGDFYDFFLAGEDTLALIIADVSGKGIPASLFMAVSRTVLKNICSHTIDPAQALAEANDSLCQDNEASMFVTLILGYYTISTGHFSFANAGHDELILLKKDGSIRSFGSFRNIALGIMEDQKYQRGEADVEPGDSLVFYTDGVTEATSSEKELFGRERLETILKDNAGGSAEEICSAVRQKVMDFQQGIRFDDVTVMVLKRQ